MKPQIIKLQPTYKKENGLWVLDINPETIVLPDYPQKFTQSAIISLPPLQSGGNHMHPRVELFAALSENLELVWLDDKNTKRTVIMDYHHADSLTFYLIPSLLPHAVFNPTGIPTYLLEFASAPQSDVKSVKIM